MTTYGTIPAESDPLQNLQIISRAKESINSSIGTPRPWQEMLQSLNLATSFNELMQRIKINAIFFRANYVIIVFILLFFWQPLSSIVFIVSVAAWLFLYFLREQPLVVFGLEIQEKIVMISLSMATIVALLFTNVTNTIIDAFVIALVVVLVHGALRDTEDLMFVDDEERCGLPRGDRAATVPVQNALPASFSAS